MSDQTLTSWLQRTVWSGGVTPDCNDKKCLKQNSSAFFLSIQKDLSANVQNTDVEVHRKTGQMKMKGCLVPELQNVTDLADIYTCKKWPGAENLGTFKWGNR